MQVSYKLTKKSDHLKILPKEIISHIFSRTDFSGKIYLGLSSKKYYRLTKKDMKLFTKSIKVHYELRRERVWFRLCADGHTKLLENFVETENTFFRESFAINATTYGLIDVLDIIFKNQKSAIRTNLYECAAIAGQIKVLEWLKIKNIQILKMIFY
jgi:hypothetical protein